MEEPAELEIEALKIAEEALLKSPELNCSLHTEFCGFVLAKLNVFQCPSLATVRYMLAKALLRNQVLKPCFVLCGYNLVSSQN